MTYCWIRHFFSTWMFRV